MIKMPIKIKRATKKTSIYKAVDNWIDSCQEKGLKPASIETYRDKIDEFLDYTGDIYVEDLDDNLVQDFKYYLKNEHHFKPGSTNTYFRCVNVFMKYLHNTYNLELFHIDYIKENKTIKPVFTDAEIKRLCVQPDINTTCYSELRTWIAVMIAVNTGARISSVANIRKQDIDMRERTITFTHSKNGRQFKLPVSKSVINAIDFYYESVDIEDYLFLNSDNGQPLTGKQLGSSFRKYCANRNIKTTTSFHSLRRWYSIKLLQQTKNIHLVKTVLQHSNIATTEKYIASLGITQYNNTLKDLDLLKGLKG